MGKSYDLNMNSWGPYNKLYSGVLNIADPVRGTTFNVEMFPGLYARNVIQSTQLCDGGIKAFRANADLTNYTYRYEIEWKDKIYADINYNISHDKRVDIACKFVNNTDLPQSVSIDLCASIQPLKKSLGPVFLKYQTFFKPELPSNTKWLSSIDYKEIKTTQLAASSGMYLGEEPDDNTTSYQGTTLSGRYFNSCDHYAVYELDLSVSSVGVRYKANEPLTLDLELDGDKYSLDLQASSEYTYASVKVEKKNAKILKISPNKAVTIDSICYGENADKVTFSEIPFDFSAEREVGGVAKEVTELPIVDSKEGYLKLYYKEIDKTYTIKWDTPVHLVRRFYCDEIGEMLRCKIQDHVNHWWAGVGKTVYDNLTINPIFLKAGEVKTVTFTVYEGDVCPEYEDHSFKDDFAGDKYSFSQNMTLANIYLNTVYPIYSRRSFIRHNTPARLFNCLYSWDSGMIGVGLATKSFERAYDNLHAYLVPSDDMHGGAILAGSTVPTQILTFKNLFDNFPEKREKLKTLYPMVKEMFRFYKGLHAESGLKSGLAKAWQYCYNSGGWDDYPPQKHLIYSSKENGEATYKNTTPVITTAFNVLFAKILKNIALYYGFENDYDEYIETASNALNNYAWNEETGYYSYVIHDEDGMPKSFLKAEDGSDYNQGFDGAYPFVAGIAGKERSQRIVDNIKNGMITKYGLSVVDMRASYYINSGYWNGTVWVPHGWVLWRSLLDNGEIELADTMVKRYLDAWSNEVDESYCTFEFINVINGRGSGVHNFSGLSSPIVDFYASYFAPNTVAVGFETIILENDGKTIKYKTEKENAYMLIVKPSGKILVNGKKAKTKKAFSGAVYVKLDLGEGIITL